MDPNVMEAGVVVSACGHDGPFGATSEHAAHMPALRAKIRTCAVSTAGMAVLHVVVVAVASSIRRASVHAAHTSPQSTPPCFVPLQRARALLLNL